MHELSIALGILQSVADEAAIRGYRTVTAVHLRIGALTAVVPDALAFSWELAASDTVAAGARLEIETVPLLVYCATCQREERLETALLLACGICGAPEREIRQGRELEIVAMEVPDEDASRSDQSIDLEQER